MLATIGEARSKHSGVISLFRNKFVRTGEIPAEMSDIYGRILDNRQRSDYDLEMQFDKEQAEKDIKDGRS